MSLGKTVKLVGLRVKNYRTVGVQEQFLNLDGPMTIVGPNNSGKTNLLRSIETFFTGHDNTVGYSQST